MSVRFALEFHTVFGHPVGTEPGIPDPKLLQQRIDFIISELEEAKKAAAEGNLVEYADALGDAQYFLDGTFVVSGLHERKGDIMQTIHDANMTKACVSLEHAKETADELLQKDGIETFIEQKGSYWLVKRTFDNKVMKAKGFAPPVLDHILYGRRGVDWDRPQVFVIDKQGPFVPKDHYDGSPDGVTIQ